MDIIGSALNGGRRPSRVKVTVLTNKPMIPNANLSVMDWRGMVMANKSKVLFLVILGSCSIILLNSSLSYADCSKGEEEAARSCYEIESQKSDDSRGGVSASEFCAAAAAVDCSSSDMNDKGQ